MGGTRQVIRSGNISTCQVRQLFNKTNANLPGSHITTKEKNISVVAEGEAPLLQLFRIGWQRLGIEDRVA